MAIIKCPRCDAGQMDSDKGETTACWFCSQILPCYVCNGPMCGAKFCQPHLEKLIQKKSEPPKPIPFRRGELGDGGG